MLAPRQRAAILNVVIVNKNAKLLLINYLARKVNVVLHLFCRSQIVGTELTAALCSYHWALWYKTPVRPLHCCI
jgi:hypothetical protein